MSGKAPRPWRSLVRLELDKALGRRNPWFWASMAFGLVLAAVSTASSCRCFVETLGLAQRYWQTKDMLYSTASCFAYWIPARGGVDFAAGVFALAWPLLAAAPYSWNWAEDLRSGALAQEVCRGGRVACLAAKAVATAASGALAVCVPLVANLLACACFAPATHVWVSDVLYTGVTADAALSSAFYVSPLAFSVAWTAIAALLAALVAICAMGLSMFLRVGMESVVTFYLSLHVLAFLGEKIGGIVDPTYSGLARSALLKLDVFQAAMVRSMPDAAPSLALTLVALAVLAAVLALASVGRDLA